MIGKAAGTGYASTWERRHPGMLGAAQEEAGRDASALRVEDPSGAVDSPALF